ncbi:hypothetical protein VIBC2010_02905 [Vibrio caribbeanicus ATCC BAA-2122]|uniref:Uncharacterized protein n=1 Tax=Vibrio caribbeanicus ATCC BAA-2122 TaxID=796620 RepID=E3BI77_9VIBR|nr:hypothetical protein VIBC2010_02905 [Vibrio caribbeanicus ATCC BAA-2122]
MKISYLQGCETYQKVKRVWSKTEQISIVLAKRTIKKAID